MKKAIILFISIMSICEVYSQDSSEILELLSFIEKTGQFDPNFQIFLKGETCENQKKYVIEELNPTYNFLLNSNVSKEIVKKEVELFLNQLDAAISNNNWKLAASILNGGIQSLNFANSTKLYSIANSIPAMYKKEYKNWDETIGVLMESTAIKASIVGDKIIPPRVSVSKEIEFVLSKIENRTKDGLQALMYIGLGLTISTYVFTILCPPAALATGVIGATLGVAAASLDIAKNTEQRSALKKLMNNKNKVLNEIIDNLYDTSKMMKSLELQRNFIARKCGPITP